MYHYCDQKLIDTLLGLYISSRRQVNNFKAKCGFHLSTVTLQHSSSQSPLGLNISLWCRPHDGFNDGVPTSVERDVQKITDFVGLATQMLHIVFTLM